MRAFLMLLVACQADPKDISASKPPSAFTSGDFGSGDLGFASGDFASGDFAFAPADFASGFASSDLASGVVCNGKLCQEDQACVNGACTFPCAGVNVPGDFADLADAAFALQGHGTGTICVGAVTLDSQAFQWTDTLLTVIGVSADRSILTGKTFINGDTTRTGGGYITIKGLDFEGSLQFNESATVQDIVFIKESRIHAAAIDIGQSQFYFEADDLSATAPATALQITGGPSTGTTMVVVENCFIHDAGVGIDFEAKADLDLLDNTFVGNTTGLVGAGVSGAAVLAGGNLFIGSSSQGVAVSGFFSGTQNGFFQDGNNTPAPDPTKGDLVGDPLFDSQAPPALGAGSPFRGKLGNPNPTNDFFGRVRTFPSDLGARQEP